jgi:hypothetical protein
MLVYYAIIKIMFLKTVQGNEKTFTAYCEIKKNTQNYMYSFLRTYSAGEKSSLQQFKRMVWL